MKHQKWDFRVKRPRKTPEKSKGGQISPSYQKGRLCRLKMSKTANQRIFNASSRLQLYGFIFSKEIKHFNFLKLLSFC